jgi:hypothetical protein
MVDSDSATIAAEILQNPNRLPELLEEVASEVELALAALDALPSARWALVGVGEFLESLAEGVAFAAENSPIAGIFVRCWGESANVPCLRTTSRDLRRIGGPTPEARRFPDAARDFAEFLLRWLQVQELATAPDTPHVDKTQQRQQQLGELNTGNPLDLSKHRSPSEFQRILGNHGQPNSESHWRNIRKENPGDVFGHVRSRQITRRLAERLGIVESLPEFRTPGHK